MPESTDKPEKDGDAPAQGTPPAAANGGDFAAESQQQPQQQPAQVQIDDSQAVASYSNFCRVTGTPEELIIDFGMNPQPFGVPTEPIPVNRRIITNLYTAKRLVQVLQLTIQRHEATFGVLETDVQRRVHPGAMRQP